MLRLMTETPEMKPQTPTGARRTDGRKDRGKRPETPEEPLMIQEFALLTGRAAKGWTDGPRRMEPRGFGFGYAWR